LALKAPITRETVTHIDLTVLPGVAWLTVADILGNIIDTLPFVQTWVLLTVVGVHLTVIAFEATRAGASVSRCALLAGPSVLAWCRCAFIDIRLACGPLVTRLTEAGEAVPWWRCVHAGSVVVAGTLRTVVDVDLTIGALEALQAVTLVAVHLVAAGGPVEAGLAGAFVDFLLAVRAIEAIEAVAGVVVDSVAADCVVLARKPRQ
jgi:hypothetical protein